MANAYGIPSLLFGNPKNRYENIDDSDHENANVDEIVDPIGFVHFFFVSVVAVVQQQTDANYNLQ